MDTQVHDKYGMNDKYIQDNREIIMKKELGAIAKKLLALNDEKVIHAVTIESLLIKQLEMFGICEPLMIRKGSIHEVYQEWKHNSTCLDFYQHPNYKLNALWQWMLRSPLSGSSNYDKGKYKQYSAWIKACELIKNSLPGISLDVFTTTTYKSGFYNYDYRDASGKRVRSFSLFEKILCTDIVELWSMLRKFIADPGYYKRMNMPLYDIMAAREIRESLEGLYALYKNGLFAFCVFDDCVVYCVNPKISINEKKSDERRQTSEWENGEKDWFLNGVKVTQEIAETPAEKLDPKILFTEKNAEIRREIVRKIGLERICYKLHAKVIDRSSDRMYELLMLNTNHGKRPCLKMRNPSIDTYHIEGVGSECETVAEALAFRMRRVTDQDIIISENGQDWYQQGDVIVYPKGAKVLKPMPVILT